jgi:hypothetical protein
MKKQLLTSILLLLITTIKAQVGIGTYNPDASAALEISSNSKGFLAPRVTLTSALDVSTVSSPAIGLMVYNTASAGSVPNAVTPGYYYFSGTKWERLITATTDATINFNTGDPNSGSPTFTPNTPATVGYIYQSTTNASQWTYNGSTYVTYTAPSTTAWNLANTTNDAGSNKTSAIWRSGAIGISTSTPYSSLSNTANNILGSDAIGTSATGITWFNNNIGYTAGVFNSGTSSNFNGLAIKIAGNTSSNRALDISQGSNQGLAGTSLFSVLGNGNVGIRTNAPATTLHMNSNLAATNTINVDGQMLRMMRPQAPYVKWENIAQFNLGSYGVAPSPNTNAFTRLDLALNDGEGVATTTVMTWLANGNVGIGATSPIGRLIVNDNSYIANIPASTAHIMDNITYRPLARLQVTSGANNNALSTYATTATFAMQAHNYSTGNSLNLSLQPIGGRVGIGSDQPIGQLANHATNYIGSIGTGVVGNNFSWSSALSGTMATLYNSGTQGNATTLLVGSAGTTTNTLIEASTGVNSSSVPTRNIFIIKGTGNIGIHKAAPTQQLHFGNSGNVTANKTYTGTADDGLIIQHYINTAGSSENVNTYARVADIVVASNVTGSAGTSVLRFLTSTNAEAGGTIGERMRIHGNGFIGIGTTSPTAQLHTNGSVRFEAAGTPGVGKVLTSDATGNATWQSTAVSTKTAAYTLAASDYGSIIIFNSSTNIDLIIPNTLSAGFNCQVIQQGTGKVTVVGASGSGVSVTSSIGPKTRTTGSIIGVLVTSATSVFLSGDTSN